MIKVWEVELEHAPTLDTEFNGTFLVLYNNPPNRHDRHAPVGESFKVVDYSEDRMGLRFETEKELDLDNIKGVLNPFENCFEKARVMVDTGTRFYRNRSNPNTRIYWVRFDKATMSDDEINRELRLIEWRNAFRFGHMYAAHQ